MYMRDVYSNETYLIAYDAIWQVDFSHMNYRNIRRSLDTIF